LINILSSGITDPSTDFVEVKRKSGQDNLAWIRENIKDGSDQTMLVMVGGKSPTSFRLRMAQSHVRSDLMPSYWSHVMLLDKLADDFGKTKIYEISLEPSEGFGFPVPENAVQTGKLREYARRSEYPNLAVLNVPVKYSEVLTALEKFKMQRAVLDSVDLVVHWLAYIWGVARSANPLLDGLGTPSSAMLEIVIGACGFDLTPGLESRSSCPEAIWQAARWWHDYYKGQKKEGLTGAYCIPHEIK
jgi:hypothetical protein